MRLHSAPYKEVAVDPRLSPLWGELLGSTATQGTEG